MFTTDIPDEVRNEFKASLEADIASWSKEVKQSIQKYDKKQGATKLAKGARIVASADTNTAARRKAQAGIFRALKKTFSRIAEKVVAGYLPTLKLAKAHDYDDELDVLAEEVEQALSLATLDAAKRALKSLGIDDAEITGLLHKDALEYASERGAEMVGRQWVDGELVENLDARWSITEEIRDGIRAALERAYDEGHTPAQLAKELESSYTFSDVRAKMIAKTETATASVQGNLIGWRKSGVVAGKEWLLSEDHPENSECDCAENADQGQVALDDDFPSGDDGPPAHPACACSLVAVLMDESDDEEEDDQDE